MNLIHTEKLVNGSALFLHFGGWLGGQWEALGKLGWWELQAGVDSGRDAYGRGKVLRNSKLWPILEWIASK